MTDSWRDCDNRVNSRSGDDQRRHPAIAATLPPGDYTAIVAGKNGASGIGLVEIYNAP